MKILVTGPDGVLGSNVVRELLSRDYSVSVMLMDASAKTPTLDGLTIKRFYGNILNPADLNAAFSGQIVSSQYIRPNRNFKKAMRGYLEVLL